MIWYPVKYLRHFFFRRHRNGHHIHSPYVFEFVNSVLFGGISRGKHSRQELIRRIRAWAGTPNPGCFRTADLDAREFARMAQRFEVLVLEEPYANRQVYRKWRELVELDQVRVSIDLFHMGILLLREDLYKVHYRIKF